MKKSILGILSLLVGIAGLYFAWHQYQQSQKTTDTSEPDVVVCLRDLSYQEVDWRNGTITHRGTVTFRLINRGGSQVTVTKVLLTIAGRWRNGREGAMGQSEILVDQLVPSHGVVTVTGSLDSEYGMSKEFYIEIPSVIHLSSVWPGQKQGNTVNCVPGDPWSCRILDRSDPSARRTLGNDICQ